MYLAEVPLQIREITLLTSVRRCQTSEQALMAADGGCRAAEGSWAFRAAIPTLKNEHTDCVQTQPGGICFLI